MQKMSKQKKRLLALVIAGMLVATSFALPETPAWAGQGNKGKSGKHEQQERRDNRDDNGGHEDGRSQEHRRDEANAKIYFGDQHRNVIRNFYAEQYRSGRCPPGLVKKHNGCMPPGQRKWQVGRPLPREVIFYDLPPAVIVQLGPPPSGHRFVRVASDILLLAVGTGMIVDAVQDLSGN